MKKRMWLLYAAYAAAVIGLCVWRFRAYRISFTPVEPYMHPGMPAADRAIPVPEDELVQKTAETKPQMTAPVTETEITETPEPTSEPVQFPLELNTADAEMLAQIPGIGPVTAEAIIAYRTEHGGFTNRAELLEIRGIGEVRYKELLGYLYLAHEQPLPEKDAPAPEPEPEPETDAPEIPVINLNTADCRQLMRLPGCTEELADSILNLRDVQIHVIRNPLEITMAQGVTDALYQQWEPYLAVDDEGGKQLPASPEGQ